MSEEHQYELSLVKSEGRQAFDEWIHTPSGGEVMNRFIRLACGMKKRGWKKYSHWSIVNRIRWHYDKKYGPNADQKYYINNNNIAHMARFAIERAPELEGFFELRKLGKRKKNHAVVIPIERKA